MTFTPEVSQGDPHAGWRHSNTPSMTSASSVYDDDSLASPPHSWQQYRITKGRDEMGRKNTEEPYAPASVMDDPYSHQVMVQQLRASGLSNELDNNTSDSPLASPSNPVYNPSSSSTTIDRLAAQSMPPPPLPKKDLGRSHVLRSASDLKAVALGSLRHKGSKKNLNAIGLPSSPKPVGLLSALKPIGLPSSPKPVHLPSSTSPNDARFITPLPTSSTAIRLPATGSPPAVLTESRTTQGKSHTESRGTGFTSATPTLGPSLPTSPANPSDKMLSRIGRNILRGSVQKKSEAFDSEIMNANVSEETVSTHTPTLTLDIATEAYEAEQEPAWQLVHTGSEYDLPLPPMIPTHERNSSSIYSASSQTLVPDHTMSTNSTTSELHPPARAFETSSQVMLATLQPAFVPAARKIHYDAFSIPPPPLTESHFMCYQNHVSMRPATNKLAPVPCMVCWTVNSEERVRCTFCAMRICKRCAERLMKDPGRSLGRLVEAVEKEE